jgi:hydroxyacylglutathione hydrolase
MPILTLPLGPLGTNCYIVADPGGTAAVIDPGGDADQVLEALATNGWRATHILLTHAHFDHIGAVAELHTALGAPVALHPLDRPLYDSGGGGRKYGLTFEIGPAPEIALDTTPLIGVGDLSFEVRFVPGHTLGHVAFYEPGLQAIFSGDVLFEDSIGRTDLPGGSYATLLLSIRDQLLTLPDATTVYPGHGSATTIGRERVANPFLATT